MAAMTVWPMSALSAEAVETLNSENQRTSITRNERDDDICGLLLVASGVGTPAAGYATWRDGDVKIYKPGKYTRCCCRGQFSRMAEILPPPARGGGTTAALDWPIPLSHLTHPPKGTGTLRSQSPPSVKGGRGQ
ncbi:hypothetical protein GMPD_13650 [Geomonas paludis]|uniref:Uncharacterized protein n=1 Tax=Geomonas paludis TaxID=2740185 RepID=A0A6V8MTF8_9BACT|nr:hypothetical protein GMPD_13650 [Geomonas paludis]